MFAITGITGQVGGKLAKALMGEGHTVRAVLRDESKAAPWRRRECDIAIAEMDDAAALQRAFEGMEGVFIVLPPIFDPSPGFAEARTYIAAIRQALAAAAPQRVVCLSTIGAQVKRESLLTQLRLMEQALGTLPMPVAFLRAAWFMENFTGDFGDARQHGAIQTFLQPMKQAVAMVATVDIANLAAALLQQTWKGLQVVELEGPNRVSPMDAAGSMGRMLQREVALNAVPRESWETLFRAQGMKHPMPRIEMLDGFNAGWIDFETSIEDHMLGRTSLPLFLKSLALAE